MRVSVVNFCSTAIDMLKFSTEMLYNEAGTTDFDYIVVTWNPSDEVKAWLDARPEIKRSEYQTNNELKYVPNLRAMMNHGWDVGYEYNDYVAIVNTDVAFGHNWLVNLVKHAGEDVIPNSVHISPIDWPSVINMNCGVPTKETFNYEKFWAAHKDIYVEGKIETEDERGGWRACASMPYVVHRKWWEGFGPWNPINVLGEHPPDQQFFERVHNGGAKYLMVFDSIVYHHEAVERQTSRPVGVEEMENGS